VGRGALRANRVRGARVLGDANVGVVARQVGLHVIAGLDVDRHDLLVLAHRGVLRDEKPLALVAPLQVSALLG